MKEYINPITGSVWKYGNDVSTDVIFPGKYVYTISEPKKMAAHALEDLDPVFSQGVRPGDIIVAGKNWGCGSSREQAVTCLKENGIGAIVAKSFGRIHYRNCLNAALPAIICPAAVEAVNMGDRLIIDLASGIIQVRKQTFKFKPLPVELMNIFLAGGLVPYTRHKLATAK